MHFPFVSSHGGQSVGAQGAGALPPEALAGADALLAALGTSGAGVAAPAHAARPVIQATSGAMIRPKSMFVFILGTSVGWPQYASALCTLQAGQLSRALAPSKPS